MPTIEMIAVNFTLLTGVLLAMSYFAKPGEIRRQIESGPAIFRSFHYAVLCVLVGWSVLDLAGRIATTITLNSSFFHGLMGLFMLSWWPFIYGAWRSPASALDDFRGIGI